MNSPSCGEKVLVVERAGRKNTVTDMRYAHALEIAIRAAVEAGNLLRNELHRDGGPRGTGGHAPADGEAEALIRGVISAAFPKHGIVGEELPDQDRAALDDEAHVWLVDPNDGTSSFIKGYRGSAVSIALLGAGRPVLGVVNVFAAPDDVGELFAWAEGCGPLMVNGKTVERPAWVKELTSQHTVLVPLDAQENSVGWAGCLKAVRFRCCPSIAARLALVAAGRAEAAISLHGPVSWDYGGGHALLLGAGGNLLDEGGQPIRYARDGRSGACFVFGGNAPVGQQLAGLDWEQRRQGGAAEPSSLAKPIKGRLIRDVGALSRAQGCLLGQLAGDSLGSLVEFQDPRSIKAVYPNGVRDLADGGCWNLIAGQPTDDSELALMLARSLVREGAFVPAKVAASYVEWFNSEPFDIGGTTHQALAAGAAAVGADPAVACGQAANRKSQSNGALMRVSPLGIYGWASPPEKLAELARMDAALTHPHPVCQDCSALVAVAIAHAIREVSDAESTFRFALDWAQAHVGQAAVRETLLAAQAQAPADFCDQQGWVLLALQNAFYQLLHASNPEEGLVDTISRGGDTDTNGCIAGALLGAVHGRDAVPLRWQERILSCRPITGMPGVVHPRSEPYWPVDALMLAERLLLAGRGSR